MIMDGSVSKRSNAIVTASYDRDFERFAILCETIDTRVRGYEHHYVLVEPRDVARSEPWSTNGTSCQTGCVSFPILFDPQVGASG
jgi:hypothetical protein